MDRFFDKDFYIDPQNTLLLKDIRKAMRRTKPSPSDLQFLFSKLVRNVYNSMSIAEVADLIVRRGVNEDGSGDPLSTIMFNILKELYDKHQFEYFSSAISQLAKLRGSLAMPLGTSVVIALLRALSAQIGFDLHVADNLPPQSTGIKFVWADRRLNVI